MERVASLLGTLEAVEFSLMGDIGGPAKEQCGIGGLLPHEDTLHKIEEGLENFGGGAGSCWCCSCRSALLMGNKAGSLKVDVVAVAFVDEAR